MDRIVGLTDEEWPTPASADTRHLGEDHKGSVGESSEIRKG